MPRSSPPKPSFSSAATPPAWQTAATVLIIVHLFCLGLGLATNAAGGKSLLAPALFRIPLAQKYLKFLWMNVGFDFYVASPLPEDGTHLLRLTAASADDSAQKKVELPAEMPGDDIASRIRRQRYQQLAYHVAFLDELYAENSDIRTTLPLSIAETWLRELKAPHEPYVLTCLREPSTRLPKAVERAPGRAREGGPRTAGPAVFETETITIYLVWDPETASYQGSRAEPAGETSEVVGGAQASGLDASGVEAPIETVPPAVNPADSIESDP